MCLGVILDTAVAEWNAKTRWAGPNLQGTTSRPLRHRLHSPSRLVGEHSAKSRTRRLFELHFLPMSSPLSCEDAENLMSQCNPWSLRTIEQSRPATFISQMTDSPSTACRIAVSRVWHLGSRFVLVRRVGRCGNLSSSDEVSSERKLAKSRLALVPMDWHPLLSRQQLEAI
ncbi:hypothetical protein N7471_011349 [Penicillium samsonianum]|uniref:uncharacterized protein n=1 Tax=Penicillium samsonianum TaxID=1882272 RepID=UPI002546D10C|nr:uncharacterized protein N7471_011349 [Penicillium samsonianum]KAJ6124032.1 hypothetical protein N7471_011349 [Penicillium samsonianum]